MDFQVDSFDPIVTGAWDTHVHAGPDVTPRKSDVIELARSAGIAEMGGLVLKNHYFPTAMIARIAESAIDADVEIASTVVLNRSVGGLNPDAVRAAHRMGACRMELPTMTAKYNMVDQHEPRTIELLDGDSLSSACRAVLDEAIDRNMVVGTGHIGIDELEVVVDYVTDREGKVLITHPELHAARDGVGLKVDQQVRLANDGVFFERCFVATLPTLGEHLRTDAPRSARNLFDGDALWDRFVEGIEATGPDRNVISTDLGQPDNAAPPRGLRECHEKLRNAGISQADLETMSRDNPEALFGKK